MEVVSELREWQKKHLSPFCLEECVDSSCCCGEETGVLMTEDQLRKAYGIKTHENIPLNHNYFVTNLRYNNLPVYRVLINVNKDQPRCPAQDTQTRICVLQDNKPKTCKEFPLRISAPVIYLSSKCDIVKTDNPAMRKLKMISKANDYKIILVSSHIEARIHISRQPLEI